MCVFTFAPESQAFNLMDVSMENTTYPSSITSLEWSLLETTVCNVKSPYIASNFFIFLQRDPRYYVNSIIIPSTVMCLLALATFLAPPDGGERISLGVSMVLGLTVFQLLIADTLPTSSKQSPILSNYLSVNFLMSCMVVPFSLININIAYREKRLILLEYRWIRVLLLEYLPCCMGMTIPEKRKKNKVMRMTGDSMENDGGQSHNAEAHSEVFCRKNAWQFGSAPNLDDHVAKVRKNNYSAFLCCSFFFG
ncbi:Neuronal acetylcholine receptor subunit alpha-7 [Holothuria leucospilota]|uniref:Neuronal acetylcholine receptor subunit alpha-7 n=1 Tax=Holothuria leucospilota TaxID=206669 RepID=A0A9Q0YTH3_HOLLE|nr:Neuronal acetylcholine receptor subunit alpha-7 [Holothuria leucospilota]